MTKSDFTLRLARARGLSVQTAGRILNATLDAIEDGLYADGRVPLADIGVLKVGATGPRAGHHPRTGESIAIAPGRAIRFHMAKSLRERLRGHPGPCQGSGDMLGSGENS